jgi:hypothetical protein
MQIFCKTARFVLVLFFLPAAFAQAQLTIQNGATLSTGGNAVITLQDIDLINNGGINQQAGDGRFVFTGTGNNTLSGNGSFVFDRLEIAKISPAKLSLSQNIDIAGGIDFTSGLIDLNGQVISLQPTALLNGENQDSRTTTNNGGYVEITSTLNAPVAVNPGNLGAVISSSQNLGNTIVRRGNTPQTNVGPAGRSIFRYYDIIPANDAALNATLRINYTDADLNGLDETTLVLWKSTDTVNWTNEGFSTRDATADYVEQTGIADFSRWTLSSISNPLPLLFTSFTAKCMDGYALIDWTTAQEENTSRFDVQKSVDGTQWQTISSVGAAGNSSIEKDYYYKDLSSSAGNSFYRIAEYDLNGSETFTAVVSVDCNIDNNIVNFSPNPVKDLLWLSFNVLSPTAVKTAIYDSKGALVRQQINSAGAGENRFSINVNGLAPGVYFLEMRWTGGNKVQVMRVLKEN